MRIRVRLDIREPIKREKKLKRPSGECVLAKFRYEKLPTFCFICGRLGHIDRHCEIYFRLPDEQIVRLWDITLRATPRRINNLGGDRWLVEDASGAEEGNILQEKKLNHGKDVASHSMKLLGNFGATKATTSMELSTVLFSKGNQDHDSDIIVHDERKRPRPSSTRQATVDGMEVDPMLSALADNNENGIQGPRNPAKAGLQLSRTCPKQ
ncbi:hypothetical protein LINPERHAP1_LOCUS26031 [Linum perenne]